MQQAYWYVLSDHVRTTRLIRVKIGQLIQNVICRATSTLDGNKSWRIPFGILFVIPVILICGVKFLPEVR